METQRYRLSWGAIDGLPNQWPGQAVLEVLGIGCQIVYALVDFQVIMQQQQMVTMLCIFEKTISYRQYPIGSEKRTIVDFLNEIGDADVEEEDDVEV